MGIKERTIQSHMQHWAPDTGRRQIFCF